MYQITYQLCYFSILIILTLIAIFKKNNPWTLYGIGIGVQAAAFIGNVTEKRLNAQPFPIDTLILFSVLAAMGYITIRLTHRAH